MAEARIAELEAMVAQANANNAAQAEQFQAQFAQLQAQVVGQGQAQAQAPAQAQEPGQIPVEALTTAFAQALAQANAGRDGAPRQYKKVGGPMPNFNGKGDESYAQFEELFNNWATYNGLSDDDKKSQLFQALRGAAGEIVNIFGPSSEVYQTSTYTVYADSIRGLFETHAQSEAAKTSFELTVQGKDENIQMYASKKLSRFRRAYPEERNWQTSSHLGRLFVMGLKSERVREQVVLWQAKEPLVNFQSTVTNAANAEASYELLDSLKHGRSGNPKVQMVPPTAPQSAVEPMEMGAMMSAIQTIMEGKEDPTGGAVLAAMQQRTLRDAQGRYIARGRGRGGQSSGRVGLDCWTCGEIGHTQRDCPKANGGAWTPQNRGRGGPPRGRGNNGGRGRGTGKKGGVFGHMSGGQEPETQPGAGEQGNPANNQQPPHTCCQQQQPPQQQQQQQQSQGF